jgi:ubiquinone/menaquinone biosynthesis C-methylase UbiE
VDRLAFDEETARQLEVLYQKRDLLRRRALVHEALEAQPGERILDAGCGPGFYVSELLERVGSEGSVTGVDESPEMLGVAAGRCEGHPNVSFGEGDITALPVEDGSFDRALSVQVLEYVPDTRAALRELHRALRPGGRVLIWDVDWTTVSWHSPGAEGRMERVLRAWDDHLSHPALPRTLAPAMRAAGFDQVRAEGHAFATADFTDESYGVATIPVIRSYVAGHPDVGPEEAAAWAAEQRELGERGQFFFACIQFGFTGVRA